MQIINTLKENLLMTSLKLFKEKSVDDQYWFKRCILHSFYINVNQKFLKFEWMQQLYQFLSMANGYSDAMRVFSKI